jgi:hypothetical protein
MVLTIAAAGLAVSPAGAVADSAGARSGGVGIGPAPAVVTQAQLRASGGAGTGGARRAQATVFDAILAAAGRIDRSDYPYVFGGGHAQAGVPSRGLASGHAAGFDCSGSVAAVLAAGGIWTARSGVPSEAGVIRQLLAKRLIAPGAGSGRPEVTLYDNPGVHIFMSINGRFWGTSDGGDGNLVRSRGGAGWLSDGHPDTANPAFRPYHVLPRVLRAPVTR